MSAEVKSKLSWSVCGEEKEIRGDTTIIQGNICEYLSLDFSPRSYF